MLSMPQRPERRGIVMPVWTRTLMPMSRCVAIVVVLTRRASCISSETRSSPALETVVQNLLGGLLALGKGGLLSGDGCLASFEIRFTLVGQLIAFALVRRHR
jgi:hypothetical protein